MDFPIKRRCTKAFLNELSESERGSFEDNEALIERGEEPERAIESHAHVVANRYWTQLEIRSIEEAADVYYAVCSGTAQIEEKGFLRSCRAVADWLRPIVEQHDPELVRRWPAPIGL